MAGSAKRHPCLGLALVLGTALLSPAIASVRAAAADGSASPVRKVEAKAPAGLTAAFQAARPAIGLAGDANVDGKVDLQDVTAVVDEILQIGRLSVEGFHNADLDQDGKITALDLVRVINIIASQGGGQNRGGSLRPPNVPSPARVHQPQH